MITLIAAGTAHGAVMAALHAAAFAPKERWGADALALQLQLPGAFASLAMCQDDAPGGFVMARVVADEAEILTLAVHPEQRRKGLATRLLHDAETTAELAGATSMFLEVAAANTAGQALYSGRGYRQMGLRRGYYGLGRDALVLRRPLGLIPGAATLR